MKMLERFRRTPRKETGILNREQVSSLVDKLLDDSRSGFIVENYSGNAEQESLLREQSYNVVVKGNGKFYLVRVCKKQGEFNSDSYSYMHIGEYGSVRDMKHWNNIQRYVILNKDLHIAAYRGYPYVYNNQPGWHRVDIGPEEASDLLRAVLKSKVDAKATQQYFEHELELIRKYNWKDRIVR